MEFLASVRKGIWKELDAPAVKVDPYRRELQRSYLKAVDTKINPVERAATPTPGAVAGRFAIPRVITSGDEKPMYRAELRALAASINAAMAKTADHETRAHLEASRDEIAKILDPKFAPAGGSGGGGIRGRGGE